MCVCLHFAYSLEPGRLGREMIAAVYNAAAGAGGCKSLWSGLIKCTESCLLINHTLHLPRTVDFASWPRTS